MWGYSRLGPSTLHRQKIKPFFKEIYSMFFFLKMCVFLKESEGNNTVPG